MMDYVMVIRPSDIFGALIWGFIILVSIWIWIDAVLYKRHIKRTEKQQQSKTHMPHMQELEITLTNGGKRKAILRDGYVWFLDCTHMAQNSICDERQIKSWKLWGGA